MNFDELEKSVDFSAVLVRDDFITSNGHDGKLDLQGQSHWSIRIIRNGESFCTDYSQGAAYRNYKGRAGRRVKYSFSENYSVADYNDLRSTVPTVPNFRDVLFCLVSDAGCAAGNTFEDFCADLGYDEDSRNAEKTYRACVDTGIRLSRMFNLDELYQLFEDY